MSGNMEAAKHCEEEQLVQQEGELNSQLQTDGMTRQTWKRQMRNKLNRFNNFQNYGRFCLLKISGHHDILGWSWIWHIRIGPIKHFLAHFARMFERILHSFQVSDLRCQDLKYGDYSKQGDPGGLRPEDLNRSYCCPFPPFNNINFPS